MADAVESAKSRRAAFAETSVPFALNMASSVGLIAVNKVLMSSFGFVWGERQRETLAVRRWRERAEHPRSCDSLRSSLCNYCAVWQPHKEGAEREACRHPVPWRVLAAFLCWPPSSRPLTFPLPELFLFVLAGNSSVAALNISLKLNSVGVYQVRRRLAPAARLSSSYRTDGQNLVDPRDVLHGASRVWQAFLLAYRLCRLVCFLGCQSLVSPTFPSVLNCI